MAIYQMIPRWMPFSTPLYIGLGDGMILVLVAVVDIFAVVVVANGRGGV